MKDIRTRLHEADTSLCLWVSCESIPELRVWGTREGFLGKLQGKELYDFAQLVIKNFYGKEVK